MNHRCPQCESENTMADAEELLCNDCGCEAWIRTSPPQPAITYDNILAFFANLYQGTDSFESEIESYVDNLRNDLLRMAPRTTL